MFSMKPSSCQLFIKMLAIIFLVLLTSFFVIVYPLFLQPAEKLESEQQKQTTLIKNIKTKNNKTKDYDKIGFLESRDWNMSLKEDYGALFVLI